MESGFSKSHEHSICRRTHIAQKLPSDFEHKLGQFQPFIINQTTCREEIRFLSNWSKCGHELFLSIFFCGNFIIFVNISVYYDVTFIT